MDVTPAHQFVGRIRRPSKYRSWSWHARNWRATRYASSRGSEAVNPKFGRSPLSSVTASVDLCSAREITVGARLNPKAEASGSPYTPSVRLPIRHLQRRVYDYVRGGTVFVSVSFKPCAI